MSDLDSVIYEFIDLDLYLDLDFENYEAIDLDFYNYEEIDLDIENYRAIDLDS